MSTTEETLPIRTYFLSYYDTTKYPAFQGACIILAMSPGEAVELAEQYRCCPPAALEEDQTHIRLKSVDFTNGLTKPVSEFFLFKALSMEDLVTFSKHECPLSASGYLHDYSPCCEDENCENYAPVYMTLKFPEDFVDVDWIG